MCHFSGWSFVRSFFVSKNKVKSAKSKNTEGKRLNAPLWCLKVNFFLLA